MKKFGDWFVRFINILLVMTPFILVWFAHYEPKTLTTNSRQVSGLVILLYMIILYLLTMRLEGFSNGIQRIRELIFGQIIAVGITDAIAALVIWMLSIHFPNLWPGFLCFCLQTIVVVVCCNFNYQWFFATHSPRNSVIIYGVRHGLENLITSYGLEKRFSVQDQYSAKDIVHSKLSKGEQERILDKKLKDFEDVFLCGLHSQDRNVILKYCIRQNKRVFLLPSTNDMLMSAAEPVHMFHLPFLKVTRYKASEEYLILKRAFDLTISGIAMIILSPLFLILALMVKSDGGPAIYKQVRLTKDGKQFHIMKFRSMRVDAEKESGAVLSAGENDPRITKVGRFIRACRLDELPQLWNIFVGDMSIVGPRPERPELAAEIEEKLPEFALRLQCKAGLTGYAQVYGKYNTEPFDKLMMDLIYIAHPSIFEDLTIILATIKILFSKESTEGVGSENPILVYENQDKDLSA